MTRTFTDQLGRSVKIPFPPKRIVSLVPSQTELLYDLGLEEEVVGITKFCVHPNQWFRSKKRVGGTKQLHLDEIRVLKPDLIIANKEENEQAQVEALAKDFPVWVSDVNDLRSALLMIELVGQMTDKHEQAKSLVKHIAQKFEQLQPSADQRVAYLIWQNPYMVAGGGTFINDMLQRCGFTNIFVDTERYPEVTALEIQEAQPDRILLSSEPYPFKEKHIEAFQAICPKATVQVVDGEMFSWYGSRMLHAVAYFQQLIKH